MDKIISGSNIIHLNKRGESVIVSANLRKAIMSDDRAAYEVISKKILPVKINDTIQIYGQTYRLNNLPTVQKLNENSYRYNFEFEGKLWDLKRCQFFNTDGTGFKTTGDFPMIGTIEVFLICLRNNMRRFSPDWEVGAFTNGETKTITFSKDSCLSALQKICDEFKVDFRIDEANGKSVINTGNFGNDLNYFFEYGKGKGLYTLTRTNVDEEGIINRMYVEGGNKNLPTAYRDYSTNLKLPDAEFLEDTNSIAKFGLKEGYLDFPDIYPSRTGKITLLGSTKFKFHDDTMDFDLNAKEADGITTKYLKPDTTAKVHFNTGNLAGYQFEIKKRGYHHNTKEFELIPFENESGQKFPDVNSSAFQFAVGDEYVLLDIWAPEIYVTNAEQKLLEAAEPEFEKEKGVKVNYRLDVDEYYLIRVAAGGSHPFNVGDKVHIKDSQLEVDRKIQIVGYSRDLLKEFKFEIDVADSYEIAFASQVALQISGINNTVAAQGAVHAQNYLNGYKRLNELNNLIFDTDGYFDTTKIKPLSIETQMLSVGAKSQMLTLEGVTIEPNFNSDPNSISFSAGKLIHFTIDDAVIKEWNFVGFTQSGLTAVNPYYVYAKCPKTGVQGEWYVSTEKIKFDEIPDYYHFLIGVLHAVANGFRFYTPLEGATMINGRYITTGKVQSVDGSTWFDLDLSAFLLNNYGGMTGKQDAILGLETVGLWFGADYANKEESASFWAKLNGKIGIKSKTATGVNQGFYLEDGEIRWKDENNIIRRRIGIENGVPYDRTYSGNGTLLYEIDSSGFHSYAIPESWVEVDFNSTTITNEFATDQALIDEIHMQTEKIQVPWKPGQDRYQINSPADYQSWKYFAGNTNSGNLQYEGYKTNNTDKTANIPNGWYIETIGFLGYATDSGPLTRTILLFFMENGNIKTQKSLTVTFTAI